MALLYLVSRTSIYTNIAPISIGNKCYSELSEKRRFFGHTSEDFYFSIFSLFLISIKAEYNYGKNYEILSVEEEKAFCELPLLHTPE